MFEIGSSLREARMRRKLELSQVERDTRIRAKYLRALEEERFDVLPGAAYAKGFLRSYADYLDLDAQRFVDEYNSRFAPEQELDAPAQVRIRDRKSTRLNSSYVRISYAVFCLKKKKKHQKYRPQKIKKPTPETKLK